MTVQKERRARYFLAMTAGLLLAVLFLGVNKVEAASRLALFNFDTANDLKIVKGAKIDLAGYITKASSWTSSDPKVVKVTKRGVATALKTGKAVISAKIDGRKEECQITVVKDVIRGSKYIKNIYRTWKEADSGKKVTIRSDSLKKGLTDLLTQIRPENEDDVVYTKCSKITAIEEDSAGATIYFEAVGIFRGKKTNFSCVAVITDDYEHEEYSNALMLQPVIWVTDEGQPLYGAGFFWYA